jgi:hypothetical protein
VRRECEWVCARQSVASIQARERGEAKCTVFDSTRWISSHFGFYYLISWGWISRNSSDRIFWLGYCVLGCCCCCCCCCCLLGDEVKNEVILGILSLSTASSFDWESDLRRFFCCWWANVSHTKRVKVRVRVRVRGVNENERIECWYLRRGSHCTLSVFTFGRVVIVIIVIVIIIHIIVFVVIIVKHIRFRFSLSRVAEWSCVLYCWNHKWRSHFSERPIEEIIISLTLSFWLMIENWKRTNECVRVTFFELL